VNILMAGYDDVEKKAELYYMDYLASMMQLPYCAHGYGSHFVLGCMDAYYKPGDLKYGFEQGNCFLTSN